MAAKRIRRLFLRSVGYALVIVVTACAVSRSTRPVLKIGLAGPFVGQYRYMGYDAMNAARLALREANAAGGVGGYSVELVAFDDQGTVAGARTVARNLLLDPQVISVLGHYLDETTEAAQEVYVDAGLPAVSAGTVQGQSEKHGALWCSLLLQLADTQRLATGGDAIRVQWITDKPYEGMSGGCNDHFVFEFSDRLPPAANVEIVLLPQEPIEAGETLKLLRKSGWDGHVAGGPALGSPLFAQVADPSGVFFASPYRWPDIARDVEFAKAYQSLGPHIPDPGPFALTTYETIQALLSAIEAAVWDGKTPSRHVLAEYLPEPSPESIYIYQWMSDKTLEQEEVITIGLPPQ